MGHVIPNIDATARAYHQQGFYLVPMDVGTKGPTGLEAKGWQQRENCIGPGQQFPINKQMGLAHAYSKTCAIDIDDLQAALAWAPFDLAALLADRSLVQISSGVTNHAKIIFRMPDAHPTLPSYTHTENKRHVIQFRCSTRAGTTMQDVLPPSIHPDTGKPYQWLGDYTQIPTLPAEVLQAWLAGLETTEVLGAKGDITTSEAEIESAIAVIDPDIHRDNWLSVAMAVHAALGDEGYHIFDDWSSNGHKYSGQQDTEVVWRSFNDTPNGITPLTLFKYARESGWQGYRRPADEVFKPLAQGPSMFENFINSAEYQQGLSTPAQVAAAEEFAQAQQPVTFWDSIKASNLIGITPEPIETLIPNFIPMQGVTGLVSPPGHGKSGFMIQLGWAMTTQSCLYNRPDWPARQGSAFILEAEDDRSEFHRRFADLQRENPEQAERYGANGHEMYFYHPANADTRLTDRYGNGTDFVDDLIRSINNAPTKIECFLVGPMINLSGGSETNEDTQAVLRQLHRIGYECQCAVLVPHHVSKVAAVNTDRSEHAARGGSSFTGSVRAQIHLQNMSAGEAETHKIPEDTRITWVGINLVKANGLPRMPETLWLKRVPHSATMTWIVEQPESPWKGKSPDAHIAVVMMARELLAKKDADWAIRTFSEEYGGTANVFGMGENLLRGHLTRACEEGSLRHTTRLYKGRPCKDLIGGPRQLQVESLAETKKHDTQAKPASEVFAASVPDFMK